MEIEGGRNRRQSCITSEDRFMSVDIRVDILVPEGGLGVAFFLPEGGLSVLYMTVCYKCAASAGGLSVVCQLYLKVG
jgi:hypothetical protein